MIKNLFFINNALCVVSNSVYSDEERIIQTLQTIESIDKYCPDNAKYMFDSSPRKIPDEFISEIEKTGTIFFYCGDSANTLQSSLHGKRSIAECFSFIKFIDWFFEKKIVAERIYKISGRYKLNENFNLSCRPNNNFVFSKRYPSWMSSLMKEHSKVDHLYKLRLWHMDFNLLNIFREELFKILIDCIQYDIDVEHSYFKHLNKYNVTEVDKIGVCGNIAPTGEYIDE